MSVLTHYVGDSCQGGHRVAATKTCQACHDVCRECGFARIHYTYHLDETNSAQHEFQDDPHHAILRAERERADSMTGGLRWVWLGTYPQASVPESRERIYAFVDELLKDDSIIAAVRASLKEARP